MAAKNSKKRAEVARAIVFGDASLTVEKILESHGVKPCEYADWLGDGEFIGEIESLAERAAEAESARVMKALAELSKGGDTKVVRLYFDLIGERRKTASEDDALDSLKRDIWGGEV